MSRWFRSAHRWDTAWHRSAGGRVAVCGAVANPALPWADQGPAGQIMCADCE